MTQEIFNSLHSETELMRYAGKLADKDYGLTNGMIPLGSCTMKLNSAIAMMPITFPGFS
jgi:glycine dehydrogenase